MPTLGQFLEISVPTESVQESLAYYRALGFSELSVGDIRNYHYAVVSDGRVCIGLHDSDLEGLALSFVQPGVARHSRSFREAGVDPVLERLGDEEFNEFGITDPDGHLILMMEARTFSTALLGDIPAPTTGRLDTLSIACARLERSVEFWENCGFSPAEEDAEETARLQVPGLTLELQELPRRRPPTLYFRPVQLQESIAVLEQNDIAVTGNGDSYALMAPEGTRLLLLPE